MHKNDEIRPLIPVLPSVSLRLEPLAVRNEGDVAHIDIAGVKDEGTSVARGTCTVKFARFAEAVLPGASSCDLMEGGMGI